MQKSAEEIVAVGGSSCKPQAISGCLLYKEGQAVVTSDFLLYGSKAKFVRLWNWMYM